MDWPHTEPTAYCDACAHAVAGELTADLATAIAERDALAETRAALTANLNALTIELGEARSELAEARRQLGEAVEVQEDLAGKLFDAVQERDALKACRHVGPWIEDRGTWRRVRTIGEAGAVYHAGWITQTMDGKAWNVASDGLVLARRVALDAAKDAADAHLIAAGWWLEGGPHKAGDAK